jgi:hypothetical protein
MTIVLLTVGAGMLALILGDSPDAGRNSSALTRSNFERGFPGFYMLDVAHNMGKARINGSRCFCLGGLITETAENKLGSLHGGPFVEPSGSTRDRRGVAAEGCEKLST